MPQRSEDLPQVVFLSSIDWAAAWQRHQVLASCFARAGHAVYFVENTGFRNPRLSDFRRITQRILNTLGNPRSLRRVHPVPPGVRLVSPLVFPPTHELFRLANRYWMLPFLARRLKRSGLKPGALVFAYPPTQTVVELIDLLAPRLAVYDVVDHFAGHPEAQPDLERTERALLDRVGLVLTTSPLLQALHEGRHPRVLRVHHGVSTEFFLPPRERPRAHRRLCYFGSLREGIDYDTLNALAEAGFEVALIGPEKDPPPSLHARIERLGMLPVAGLVRELRRCDALLLPYTDSEFNRGITPAKIYECLATGLPVISSPLPGVTEMEEHLYLARSPSDFAATARGLDAAENPDRAARRVAFARRYSCDSQFQKILRELDAASGSAVQRPPPRNAQASRTLDGFIRGFTWIAFFFASAKTATLMTQILAARLLGPGEYGKANMIVAVNSLLQILPMAGFPLALARTLPMLDSEARRRGFLSTALASFCAWAVLCFLFLSHPSLPLRLWGGLRQEDWMLALLLAFATAGHFVVSSALQGLSWFKKRGFAEALYGLGTLTFLALFSLSGNHHHSILILSLIGSLVLSTAYGLWLVRGYLAPLYDVKALRTLLPFAALGTLNVLAAAFVLAPGRLILFHRVSAQSAGVYSAYFNATAQISLALISMAWTVLIPLTSLPEGQREAWHHLKRLAPRLTAAATALFFLFGASALALAGPSYPLKAAWLGLFALAAGLIFTHGIFSALYASRDRAGLWVSAIGSTLAGTSNLALSLLWAPRWGVAGAAAALAASYLFALGWCFAKRPAE